MKRYGIGYTIFAFEGNTKHPIDMAKARPGNLYNEVARLEKRIKKMNSDMKLGCLCVWALVYGFSVRILLSL